MIRAARSSENALFFIGSLFSSPVSFLDALQDLRTIFGPVLSLSDIVPWTVSDYYREELGTPLYRRFIFFSKVVETGGLAQSKCMTDEIELRHSLDGRRRINLDPGYITLAKVVLASRKNYSHRIHLGGGVYAELELYYENGRFKPLPYTYRDYREERSIAIFNDARSRLKKLLGTATAQNTLT